MKMKFEHTIKASPEFVWAAFDNPDNLAHWQPTLKSFTRKSGEPGQPGTIAELEYEENGRRVLITETVTERRQPHFLAGTYESSWGRSLIVIHFERIDKKTTRLTCYSNMKFKGIMKMLSLFLANSIRRRTARDLDRFKLFVESEAAGNPT